MARNSSTGWDAMDDFGDSDQLILSDDGEQAHYIPMTEPVPFKDQWKNERAEIIVVRCGDDEVYDPAEWVAQSRRMGKREFNSYKALAKGQEGKIMLILRRSGVRDSTSTRYGVALVREVTPAELASCQALLADYEKSNK